MFKYCIFFAVLAVALSAPTPEAQPDAKAEAKPGIVAAAYTAPVVTAPLAAAPVAYTAAAYTAPVGYVAPAVLNAGYTAYSPYSGALVVV